MIRNIAYSLIPAATALFLLASCNREEMPGMEIPTQTDSPQEIRFEVAYATPVATPDKGVPGTRVSTSTDGTYTNTWEEGDEVGVYIVKGDAGLQASGNWVDNMKMTFSNESWDYTLPAGKEFYPDGELLSFYAYYPYSATFTPTSQSLTLPADQSGQTDFSDLYLFTARTTGVRKSSQPVRLEFSSALAMIELSLTSGGDGGRLSDRIVATMEKGCKLNFTLALETGKVEAEGDVAPITLRRVEQPGDADYRRNYTYRAIVPAQTLAGNEEFCFAYKDVSIGSKLRYSPAEAVMLEQGWVKPFNITLKPLVNPDYQYRVGDVYPHNGLPMGVVYEIDNTGKHGKIVYYGYTYTTWGKEGWIPVNENSGKANMKAVYEANNGSFDGYPPFQWADGLNLLGTEYTDDAKGIWYLPAKEEVKLMLQHWKPDIISSLQRINGLSYPEEKADFGTSTSASVISYEGWRYKMNDYDLMTLAANHKTERSSNFFAVMEF